MILTALALMAAPPVGPTLAYPKIGDAGCTTTDDAESFACRATQAASEKRYAESAGLYEGAAARIVNNQRRAETQAAAGNMWIAAGDYRRAIAALDKALTGEGLTGVQLGMAQIDRARAAEASGDLKTARAQLTSAMTTVAEDPFLWYFSAALAVREQNIPLARAHINRALSMAPDSPEVLFEAGHVAQAAGDNREARDYWEKVVAMNRGGSITTAARDAIAMLEVPLTVTNQVATRPDGDGEGEDKPRDQPQD